MIDRLERLINLVIALRETRQPMTADEVRHHVAGYGQEDPDAFRRMFERDKKDLRALGVPVETTPLDPWGDDRVGYRIPPERYDLPETQFDADELTALAVALQATGLGDEGTWALRKLEVAAGGPPPQPRPATRLEVELDAPHRDILLEAQRTRTTVQFRYRPLGRRIGQRTVDPHALVHRGGRWYLVGRDHRRDAQRAFRLDRIEGKVATIGQSAAFEAPPEVGVDDVVPHLGNPDALDADVLASPAVAWQVARRARTGGRPAQAPPGADDGPWTRFSVVVGDAERFVAWALEFGPDVVVLGPPDLRSRVLESLEATCERAAQ